MSKKVLQHPEVPANELDTQVWRGLQEFEETKKFRHEAIREFRDGEDVLTDEERELSRRNFVKLMGASSALAGVGLVSCRRPESYILPYADAPEWVIPGKPLYYATNMPTASGAVPLVVTTYEARPTMLAPNKKHPDQAGTDALVQASILNLYSPSRSKKILKNGVEASKEDFAAYLKGFSQDLSKTAVVFGQDDSPTRSRLVKKLNGVKAYSYEAMVNDEATQAVSKAYGVQNAKLVPDFSKAAKVISFDSDFLGTDSAGTQKAFFKKRQGGEDSYNKEIDKNKMNRLYQVESNYSLTGGFADHRLRIPNSQVSKVAVAFAKELAKVLGNSALASTVAGLSADFTGEDAYVADWVKAAAKDFAESKTQSLALAGLSQSTELHILVAAINDALQAVGNTLNVFDQGAPFATILDLKKDVEAGTIENVILITPSNPLFDASCEVDFASILEKAKVSIHLGERADKTAYGCDWHVPRAHYLESWSDAVSAYGYYSLLQPMILPLHEASVSEIDFLTALLNGGEIKDGTVTEPSGGYYEVKNTFSASVDSSTVAWKELLKNGFAPKAIVQPTAAKASAGNLSKLAEVYKVEPSKKSLEITFSRDSSILDGRYIDNAWLQEAPDPITKLTWDNLATVSPKTAKSLGIYKTLVQLETSNAARPEYGEAKAARAPYAIITLDGEKLEIPVVIGYGQADYTINLPVGYGQGSTDGRKSADKLDESKAVVGHVGRNTGFNTYPLKGKQYQYIYSGAKVETTDGLYEIASTQEHHAMYGRALAREISTNEVPGKGDFKKQLEMADYQGMDSHIPPNISLYKQKGSSTWHDEIKSKKHLFDKKHQWAMSIDLNTCTGCNACLVACQAENNIPVVGKEQVAMGREMHWIRMDRYFASQSYQYDDHGHKATNKETGEYKKAPKWVSENPAMLPQPVACVQCQSAPCETVCPVNATVHTEEGLNSMAYNRCIGTRYCANNCPYKARRFNFFDYNKRNPFIEKNLYKGPLGEKKVADGEHLQRNPNVSVRMRGVMEKCTYCVQRLEMAKIKQKQITKKKAEAAGSSLAVNLTDADLRIKTDSVKVACQEACPSDAISFGNMLNKEDTVNRARDSKRTYELLKYIGTFARTTYMARVKNPNPAMPDAKYVGVATINIH